MKFIVYPNPRRRTVHKYDRVIRVDATGREQASTTDNNLTRSPFTKYTFMAGISANNGGKIKTGLDVMISNPYKDLTSFRNPEWEKLFKNKEEALRQHVLEYKHNVPYNYYTSEPVKNRFGKTSADLIPYFQTSEASWELKDGANVFSTEKPKDELFYYAARESKLIANSYSELNLDTDYYIAKESENEDRTAEKSKRKDKAIAKLTFLEERDDDTLIKFVKALNIPIRNIKKNQAYNILRDYIDKSIDNIKAFNYVYGLWNEPTSRSRFNGLVLFKDYTDYRIIVNNGGTKYNWVPPREESGRQPDTVVWKTKDQLIEFLIDPENSWALDEMELQYKFKNRL